MCTVSVTSYTLWRKRTKFWFRVSVQYVLLVMYITSMLVNCETIELITHFSFVIFNQFVHTSHDDNNNDCVNGLNKLVVIYSYHFARSVVGKYMNLLDLVTTKLVKETKFLVEKPIDMGPLFLRINYNQLHCNIWYSYAHTHTRNKHIRLKLHTW